MNKTFTKKEKISIIIFSLLILISYIFLLAMYVLGKYKNINIFTTSLRNIYFYLIVYIICWIGLLSITFLCLKGFWINYKLKNDKDTSFFLISSIISIFYSVLNYPLYVFPLPHTMWICLEYLGLFYLFYFIIKTRK